MAKEGKFNPEGTLSFLNLFLASLKTKKLVALFDKYEDAKTDVIMEFINSNHDLEPEIFHDIVKEFEGMMYLERWFNEL